MVAYTPEAVLHELVGDDSIVNRLPELQATLKDECAFVEKVKYAVWKINELLSGCLGWCHVAAGLTQTKVFKATSAALGTWHLGTPARQCAVGKRRCAVFLRRAMIQHFSGAAAR